MISFANLEVIGDSKGESSVVLRSIVKCTEHVNGYDVYI